MMNLFAYDSICQSRNNYYVCKPDGRSRNLKLAELAELAELLVALSALGGMPILGIFMDLLNLLQMGGPIFYMASILLIVCTHYRVY